MRALPSPLQDRINALLHQKSQVLLAIDGPCGGGKSTLTEAIAQVFPNALIIRADDFFLQPHQRMPQRLSEPGGNLDRERLIKQVLKPLVSGGYQGHQRYNCQTGLLEAVPGASRPLIILEGSYSHHPDLSPFYDLKVFLDIDNALQLSRLEKRCRPEALAQFINSWIPMENAYFSHFDIRNQADIRLSAR